MAIYKFTGSYRALAAVAFGIALYLLLGNWFSYAGEVAVFLVAVFLVLWVIALKRPLHRYRSWAGSVGIVAVAATAFWACCLKNNSKTLPVPPHEITHYKITLSKAVAVKATSVSSVGRLEGVRTKDRWYPAQGNVAVFFPRSPKTDTLQYGQELLVIGQLTPPTAPANPYQFDYRRYLALKHIQWQAYLPAGTWLSMGKDPPGAFVSVSLQVRKKLEAAFKKQIKTAREVTIAQALVLGVQDDLDASLRNAYARTGTMHVLAVSGLHVGLLYGVLLMFLRPLRQGRSGKLMVFLLIVGVVWFYAFVTGLSASVLRSVCMFSLVELGRLLRRKSSILNTLAVVALGLLLYEPNFLFDVGFQLSFLAVAGIVLLQPLFLQFWRPEQKVVQFIWELLAISVAAQLATFPVSLYYFHQFPVYFWVANLVAVPLTSLALYIGVGFMAFFGVPYLNRFLGFLLEQTLWLLNELLLWLEHWPYAVLDGFVITPGQVVALYLFVITSIAFLFRKKLAWLAGAVLCVAFISGTELAEARLYRKTQELTIHSVRRSSAVSILHGREATLLADSSFYAQAQLFGYQVQPYWWAKGIRSENRFEPVFRKTASKQNMPVFDTPDGNRLLVWKGKKLFWLRHLPKPFSSPVTVDVLVLQHNVWVKPQQLQKLFHCRSVILDQTNSRGYTQRKAQELKAAGYQVQVLEEKGAWQMKL